MCGNNVRNIHMTVKEIFNQMRANIAEYNRKLNEDIFSANARMNDEQIWVRAYQITVEELEEYE